MEPIDYLKAIRRRWLIIVTSVAIVVPLAWFTSTVVAPTGPPIRAYKASTIMLSLGNLEGSTGLSNLTTLAAVVNLPAVAERVAKDINYKGDPNDLVGTASASADTNTGLLTVTANSSNPNEAKVRADAFAKELLAFLTERQQVTQQAEYDAISTQMKDLQKEIDSLNGQIGGNPAGKPLVVAQLNAKQSLYAQLATQREQLSSTQPIGNNLVIIQDAEPSLIPIVGIQPPRSRKSRVLLAALVALLIGVAIALIVERFDSRIRTKEGAERKYRLPVLAEIPLVPRWKRHRRVVPAVDHPHSVHADAFRLLGAGLDGPAASPAGNGSAAETGAPAAAGWPNGGRTIRKKAPRTILVTSAGPSEGKSTVVANLAATYGNLGKKVLVLSCDFRHPRVHDLLGSTNKDGLAEALTNVNGTAVLDGHIQDTKVRDVRIVPSGGHPERPAMLLASSTMERAIEEAKQQADVVLFDTPPILASADATQLLTEVDRVVIVARAGKTTGELAERTSELLDRLGAPVAGVVLNGAKEAPLPKGYYRYRATVRGVKKA